MASNKRTPSNTKQEMEKSLEIQDATVTDEMDVKQTTDEDDDFVIPTSRKRKVTYERTRDIELPDELEEHFAKYGFGLRLIRYSLDNREDFKNLYQRERSGYEFVTLKEIPKKFRDMFVPHKLDRDRDTILTINDLCLMKAELSLLDSRRKYYENVTKERTQAADIFTTIKKHGLKDLGTKTTVSNREPTFQE